MPRIAFFPDSFHEVNGVAHTARNFAAFAEREAVPMLCVRAGNGPPGQSGCVQTLELPRSRAAVPLEQDLSFDPLFFRHLRQVETALKAFGPEVIHITGPSELGLLGAWFAWRLGVPLAASWHTNVHEYAARRLLHRIGWIGTSAQRVSHAAEGAVLAATAHFYRLAKVLYAPNPALCALLARMTGRPCHLMQRGVDTNLFTPAKRTRDHGGSPVLGYVGRLSVEKNVAQLPIIQNALLRRGIAARWLIVGHGAEEPVLRRSLGEAADFPGVLRGEALAEAYADMDLLVFPSHTDTFGNVVLEALASGVPAVVTPDGGPASIVQGGVTGRIASDANFPDAIGELLDAPERLSAMRQAARTHALGCSWNAVFQQVLAAYPVPAMSAVPR